VRWRRLYRSCAQPRVEPALLPVDIAQDIPVELPEVAAPERPRKADRRVGIIEIVFPTGARLRCDQHVDRQALPWSSTF
jgi:hypothetical protein